MRDSQKQWCSQNYKARITDLQKNKLIENNSQCTQLDCFRYILHDLTQRIPIRSVWGLLQRPKHFYTRL
ncbi:hypothetical protein BI308_20920 [Roseofilum reptotaenium AO1-A]|uniref:Uncharacterized protein n=1 Tax=Roseofilum reptotaenium AO1-A TaxID=1925591 RepID=A0A1L9QLW5_9CYAN|nr:hypothetical protein BI308_20920 [Roseofilum reptotaenium AO1-A]